MPGMLASFGGSPWGEMLVLGKADQVGMFQAKGRLLNAMLLIFLFLFEFYFLSPLSVCAANNKIPELGNL